MKVSEKQLLQLLSILRGSLRISDNSHGIFGYNLDSRFELYNEIINQQSEVANEVEEALELEETEEDEEKNKLTQDIVELIQKLGATLKFKKGATYKDGGTQTWYDVNNKIFYFVDKRISSKTKGEIYANAHPNEKESVMITGLRKDIVQWAINNSEVK